MRLIPNSFSRSPSTTCLCWRLMREDGYHIGLTDHDAPLTIAGLTFSPGASMDAGRFGHSLDLRPQRADADGAFTSDALTESDLVAGLWDGARVDVLRADWKDPSAAILIWSGRFSEISHANNAFSVELVSLKADLERPVGRIFARGCDAVLGDDRCTIEPNGRTCDQRFETCRDRFSNTSNFRGFPHLPGPDAVLAGPAANGNTGEKR